MFLQYKPRESSTPNDRPQIFRSIESQNYKCHPTQIQRASLGDTQGAVFLPFSNRPVQDTLPTPTSRYFHQSAEIRAAFGGHRLPTLMESFSMSSVPNHPRQVQHSSLNHRLWPKRPCRMVQSSSKPILNSVHLVPSGSTSLAPAGTNTLASPVHS